MAEERNQQRQGSSNKGFASMDEDKQREIARKGGESVPNDKRSFSQDRGLAAQAGRKGGESVPNEKRSFSQDRELAAQAGRKGGEGRSGTQQPDNRAGNRMKREDLPQGAEPRSPFDEDDARGNRREDRGNFAQDRDREPGRKGGQQ